LENLKTQTEVLWRNERHDHGLLTNESSNQILY